MGILLLWVDSDDIVVRVSVSIYEGGEWCCSFWIQKKAVSLSVKHTEDTGDRCTLACKSATHLSVSELAPEYLEKMITGMKGRCTKEVGGRV